ncbi:MAG: tetratricopeptide repeat protein [Gemmatimonadaceae bacterium]
MSAADRRSALTALDAARPAISRLDLSRDAEDVAADIIEAWSAVETSLRSLLGGSSLAGQPLIHEARQRHLVSLTDANALAGFLAARDRVQRTEYRPSESDIEAAREGFSQLERELATTPAVDPALREQGAGAAGATPATAIAATAEPRRRRGLIGVIIAGVVVLAAVVVAVWLFAAGDADADYERGVALYQSGSREAAAAKFAEAVREDPSLDMAYVFLARIARERNDLDAARRYAEQAIQLDSENATAMDEMARIMFTAGNYELARSFFVRALAIDGTNREAQGYLGCSLVRLGRIPEGIRFLQRAGPGPWTQCAPPLPAS